MVIRSKKDNLQALLPLISALGSLHRPTVQVVTVLYDLSHSSSRDVRSEGLLALGIAAKNLARESSGRSSAIVSYLAAQLSTSFDLDEKTTLLLALETQVREKAEDIFNERNVEPAT